jgi:hypothetical protein
MSEPTPFEIASPSIGDGVPPMRPFVVDGLLRRGEICNFIGASKTGKTWMLYHLIAALASGGAWLGRQCTQSRVLLVDNELHPETAKNRMANVVDALGMDKATFDERVRVAFVRGRMATLEDVEATLRGAGRGAFDVIALDAFYRFLNGVDENANGEMTGVYNHLDRIAEFSGAAIINVHHSSKGDQSNKATTDVGSGAGAIARATDTHLAFLRHMEEGCVVLRGECRSSRRPMAVGLRLNPPFVTVDPSLNLEDLWTPKKAAQKGKAQPMTVEEFVREIVDNESSKTLLIAKAQERGVTQSHARWLADEAIRTNKVKEVAQDTGKAGNRRKVLVRVDNQES